MSSSKEQVFLRQVAKDPGPDGCWHWRGKTTTNHDGRKRFIKSYALFGVDHHGTRERYAHRWAYLFYRGAPLTPHFILHQTCDTPLCVNPWHWVSIEEPGADWEGFVQRKYRATRGERHPRARLTEEAVRAIRAAKRAGTLPSRRQTAQQYGVGVRAIDQVLAFITWRHVT